MNGPKVRVVVGSALAQWKDVVNLVGFAFAADVADAVVQGEDALGSALLFPSADGSGATLALVLPCLVLATLTTNAAMLLTDALDHLQSGQGNGWPSKLIPGSCPVPWHVGQMARSSSPVMNSG